MNDGSVLELRRRGLEESFFAKENARLIEKIRTDAREKEERRHLAELLGDGNESLIDSLIALGIDRETIPALTLVPLIYVAWADQILETKEIEAVISAAEKLGMKQGGTGMQLLTSWLHQKPGDELKAVWSSYYQELSKQLSDSDRDKLVEQVMGFVKQVAEAAGGILGNFSISSSEKSVIKEFEQAMREK